MESLNFNCDIYQYKQPLLDRAFAYTRDEDDAADLVQDTFMKAFRFSAKFELGSNVRAWLFTILKNTFLNHYHKVKRKNEMVTQGDELTSVQLFQSATSNSGTNKFMMEDIQKALSCLPEDCRYCFTRYFEGYKYHEIADEMNIPLGTVKTKIHVSRHLLKKMLKNYNVGVNI
ncbi:RNA polymerase sigma factor [Pedobacter fastidiosus]|uniref:RNA polymerase sigma factor n=1 Tax=Pedobacter fastidiosus TaxID=2765361 RepID=A0ABR7KXR1_9SPHI|nr:RNA polymerase sigma factor [Pedobacter fastidiosus]MBC6112595.1 RNA polymerase sigma factor [Pedobacter fastidiosus]